MFATEREQKIIPNTVFLSDESEKQEVRLWCVCDEYGNIWTVYFQVFMSFAISLVGHVIEWSMEEGAATGSESTEAELADDEHLLDNQVSFLILSDIYMVAVAAVLTYLTFTYLVLNYLALTYASIIYLSLTYLSIYFALL